MQDDVHDRAVLLLLHSNALGLKNAGATYPRLMDRVLAPMIGLNVQAYGGDLTGEGSTCR